jgi:hypothetical protein
VDPARSMMPNPLYQALVEVLESSCRRGSSPSSCARRWPRSGPPPPRSTTRPRRRCSRGHVFRRLQHGGRSPADARSAVAEMGSYLQATVPVAPPVATRTGPAGEADDADASPPPPPPAPTPTSSRTWSGCRRLSSPAQHLLQLARGAEASVAGPVGRGRGARRRRRRSSADGGWRPTAAGRAEARGPSGAAGAGPGGPRAGPRGRHAARTPAVRRLETLVATVREAQTRRTWWRPRSSAPRSWRASSASSSSRRSSKATRCPTWDGATVDRGPQPGSRSRRRRPAARGGCTDGTSAAGRRDAGPAACARRRG